VTFNVSVHYLTNAPAQFKRTARRTRIQLKSQCRH